MMADMKFNETSLLGASKKFYGRSYGTTQRSLQETYIKHYVTPDDTLQGIALKYGVTVEQIKRANKLYTNDSIFLRTTLSIPVGDQPLPAHVLENATSSANSNTDHSELRSNIIKEDSSDSEHEEDKEKKEDEDEEDAGRDKTMDFFNRIDRQLREEKDKMEAIESGSHITEIEALSPKVVASRVSSTDPSRRASTPGLSTENSYQHSTVRVSSIDRRRSADVVAMPNFSGKGGDCPMPDCKTMPVLRTPSWAE